MMTNDTLIREMLETLLEDTYDEDLLVYYQKAIFQARDNYYYDKFLNEGELCIY